MYEEGVVQDVELVVHQAELESLVHLVRPALPGQSFLVPRMDLMRDGQGWAGLITYQGSLLVQIYIGSHRLKGVSLFPTWNMSRPGVTSASTHSLALGML